MKQLIDDQHPIVRETARKLTEGKITDREKIESIFYFVRDEIKYMLLPGGDQVPASEIIAAGQGQCNNKNVAFLALCKAASIPARMHFGLIVKTIARGLGPNIIFQLAPNTVSHSWMEICSDGPNGKQWKRIDTHILDDPYFQSAKRKIRDLGWDMGYGVAEISQDAFILYDSLIPQTPIIPEEHGAYERPEEYFASDRYANKLNWFTALAYKLLIKKINRQLDAIRVNHSSTE